MITFLPVEDFDETMTMLDDKRLGGQRMEARAILKWIRNPERYKNFQNAGFCRMWHGFQPALALYYNAAVREWEQRGFKNIECKVEEVDAATVEMPPWLGDKDLHSCHRAALLQKDPSHYSQFGWAEAPQVQYLWPERQEDGSWKLVPPKNGRSQPKKGNNSSREHWTRKAARASKRKTEAAATPVSGDDAKLQRKRSGSMDHASFHTGHSRRRLHHGKEDIKKVTKATSYVPQPAPGRRETRSMVQQNTASVVSA